MKRLRILTYGLILLLLASCNSGRESVDGLNPEMFQGIELRSIGPGTYAGRISDIKVHPNDDATIFVAASSGGIFKTTNGGESWKAIFDKAGTSLAIGDMAISKKNPDLLWVGSGEASGEQNPASVGDGIYKSVDGGESWQNMGLTKSRHFSKVEIHPDNDDIVFAGATGSRWGENEERGVYRTKDGGLNWEKVLYINSNTGISDIVIHPDGKTIFASAWEQRRSAWAHVRRGPNSGLYKSEDGGDTWSKCEDGLPGDEVGRIALAIAESNPEIIYACYEHDSLGLFRSEDRGKSWAHINAGQKTAYWYGRIYVNPLDHDHIFNMGTYIQESVDGGKTFKPVMMKDVHVDHHILWLDPKNTDHRLLGNDGGFYCTHDAGKSWDFIANLPIGQYYDISVDNRDPYWVYGGLQDNGVWGGPSRSDDGRPITNSDIISISGGDGFYSDSEPEDPSIVYGESQYGFIVRFNQESNKRQRIRPRAGEDQEEYRFNWNTPFFISSHKPYALYIGAQLVLKSMDRGESWEELSTDLSKNQDLDSVLVIGMKPTLKPYNTITSLSESPLRKGLLYAGTDDGRLHISMNDGDSWKEISNNIPAPDDRFFTRIVASAHDEASAYISFGRFYEASDLKPYIFKTNDYGETWQDLGSDMPTEAVVRAISEDPLNPLVLFAGTHNGLLISIDQGVSWTKPLNNFPHVAVDDIVHHDNDLVLGTYGRGIWILDDISFVSKLTPDSLNEEHILFDPVLFETSVSADSIFENQKYFFVAPEKDQGVSISYYLKDGFDADSRWLPQLTIENKEGTIIYAPEIPFAKGFNRYIWKTGELEKGNFKITLKTRKKVSIVSVNL